MRKPPRHEPFCLDFPCSCCLANRVAGPIDEGLASPIENAMVSSSLRAALAAVTAGLALFADPGVTRAQPAAPAPAAADTANTAKGAPAKPERPPASAEPPRETIPADE